MSRIIQHVPIADVPEAEGDLSADFDCVYKVSEGGGRWTVIATNLALGSNEEFRQPLVQAAGRTGISPVALAALIDAEAAKLADGKWDVNSRNPSSSACGLTQFLEGTWIGEAAVQGRHLNTIARQLNFIDANGQVLDRSRLLDLRFDAACSIITAAEYGKDNLIALTNRNLIAADASDDEKAHAIYLAHHEGRDGAISWLSNGVGEEAARQKPIGQIGEARAQQVLKILGRARGKSFSACRRRVRHSPRNLSPWVFDISGSTGGPLTEKRRKSVRNAMRCCAGSRLP